MENPRDVVQHWTAKMMADPEKISAMDASYKFVVSGTGGGSWIFTCRAPIGVKEGDGAADCTIRISAEDFVALGQKRLNPQVAYLTGQIEIEGDLGQALKLTAFV